MKATLTLLFVAGLLVLLPPPEAYSQDTGVPDTVYYGDNGTAYGLPGGTFKIPFYIATDQPIRAFATGMEYFGNGVMPIYDSVSTLFATPGVPELFTLLPIQGFPHLDGIAPDTIGLVGLTLSQFLQPGRYKMGDVYFHGLIIGDQVTADSCVAPVNNPFTLAGESGNQYTPQFVGGTLQIVNAPAEFFLLSPTQYSGDAGYPLGIIIELVSGSGVTAVVLDSIVNAATGVHVASDSLPEVAGLNPSQTVWTPNTIQFGIWYAYFTIYDEFSNLFDVAIRLDIGQLPANCDIVRGDFNCDALISISDAVGVINYLFGGGPPPGCQQ